ncbi:DUF2510 domain-containing protein [Curtobacterium sp. MCBD17_008]|uniref:DUF2510 domain-containing protein n=1 Tax=Curtobacterium sp. MCBD17_008 TaxID=2175656 RepID=UPI000DAAAD8E|nr:DUF2510 domain-containing protein [Curtobacterium sp. MCBD17_008]PZE90108.1 hypothetical protein DEI95_12715 [Curtobacterium sp. MCBD17_008]
MTLPAAGWFPDPRDTARLRWWDGHAWGETTRVLPRVVPEPALQALAVSSGPAFSVEAAGRPTELQSWAYGSTERRFCVFAVLAVLSAVVSLVLNPWGVCSLLAVVTGVVALVRPGATGAWRVVGQSVGTSALVLAVATGVVVLNTHLHLF